MMLQPPHWIKLLTMGGTAWVLQFLQGKYPYCHSTTTKYSPYGVTSTEYYMLVRQLIVVYSKVSRPDLVWSPVCLAELEHTLLALLARLEGNKHSPVRA